MRVLCSSQKPMRKTPVSGFPRALLSLSHARKRRALASRLVSRKADIRKFHAYEAKYKYQPHTDLDKMEPDSWYSSASKNSASSSSSLLEYDVNGTRLPRVGVTL